jgi:arylformamidase
VSDSDEILISAAADGAAPGEALAAALEELMTTLAAAGAGPPQIVEMTWTASEPAAIHPARPAIERVWREMCGGSRPPIRLRRAGAGGVRVEARVRRQAPPSSEPLWHGLAGPALARDYSPRGQVASMRAVFARWAADGAADRAGFPGLDLAYGPSRLETLDFFRPEGAARPPLWVFIHGGYWQASDKDQYGQFGAGMRTAGFAVANLNYGLAPETPIEGAVAQVRAALRFLAAAADDLGFDATRLHLAGHSAGGHLAAMAAADAQGPRIASALLLSGLFDLRPLALLPMGRVLGLGDRDTVARLSPIELPPPAGVKIGVAVGSLESAEFKWQSAQIAERWRAPPPFIVAGMNHFTLLDGLRAGPLLDYAVALAGD